MCPNKIIKQLAGVLLLCSFLSSLAVSQGYSSREDSLRATIQDLIERGEKLQSRMTLLDLDAALHLVDSATKLSGQELGYYDSLHAWSLYSLSMIYNYRNDPVTALSCAEKMLEIVDSSFSNNARLMVHALAMLGDTYVEMSEYTRALEIYNREIAFLNQISPLQNEEEVIWLVLALDDCARTQSAIGAKNEIVLETYYRALDFCGEWLGSDHRICASTRSLIASQLLKMRRYEEAYIEMAEAIPILTEGFGPEHITTVWASCTFADILKFRNINSADSLINKQLEIIESTLGESHLFFPNALASRITLLTIMDSLELAVKETQHLVSLCRQKSDFPSHALADALRVQGKVAVAAGKYELLAKTIDDLILTRHSYLLDIFGYASESQKLSFVRRHPPIESQLLAGVIQDPHPVSNAAAINMVLRGKGLAMDVMSAQQIAAVCKNDPFVDSLLMEHGKLCERIASIVLSSAGGIKDELLEDLFHKKETLETKISTICTVLEFPKTADPVSYQKVISCLPRNSALLEYVRYEDYDYENIFMNREFDSAYSAIILTSSGEKTIIGLGDASVVDNLIGEYLTTMSSAFGQQLSGEDNESVNRINDVSARLHTLLFVPFEDYLSDVEKIYVAPDGMLNLLPFETLMQDSGKYLIEDYQFIYLTSGRDLLKNNPDLSSHEAYVIANPDFMTDPSNMSVSVAPEMASEFVSRCHAPAVECLASMFSPLPMTKQEGVSVADLLSRTGKYDVTYLELGMAREGIIKSLSQPPDILHLATHGYFCEQGENAYLSNPLLRSGLILAGANRTIGAADSGAPGGEDGVLTAMEVSGLNLIGTDLVVLSACQTGIGDIQSGEGVFGLRSAFLHAGAKSVVMSMFAVPDESTSDLMKNFYQNWLSGQSKASALRNASLKILNERRLNRASTNPIFWGGFILVGDPE